MKNAPLKLFLLANEFSVVKVKPETPMPAWLFGEKIFSVTRTATELSIVCVSEAIPDSWAQQEESEVEKGWRAFMVDGPLEFHLTGILSSIASPLAAAGVSLFAVSTFDTDYILVKNDSLKKAVACLGAENFAIEKVWSES